MQFSNMKNGIPIVIFFFLIISVVTGYFIYIQSSALKEQLSANESLLTQQDNKIAEIESEASELKGEIGQLNTQSAELSKQLSEKESDLTKLEGEFVETKSDLSKKQLEVDELTCTGEWISGKGCLPKSFRMVQPLGGEKFCYGDLFTIEWKQPVEFPLGANLIFLKRKEGGSLNSDDEIINYGIFGPTSHEWKMGFRPGYSEIPDKVNWLAVSNFVIPEEYKIRIKQSGTEDFVESDYFTVESCI